MKKIIHIGADHAGFTMKEHLISYLRKKSYDVHDCGSYTLNKNDDYPDLAAKVAKAVQKTGLGILICGSAEGVCIAANKLKKIRATPVWSVKNAKLSRAHNDANILCLSGWQLTKKEAEKIAITWLTTPFSNEKRHKRRIQKIKRLER